MSRVLAWPSFKLPVELSLEDVLSHTLTMTVASLLFVSVVALGLVSYLRPASDHSGSFDYTPIYKVSQRAPEYWKLPLRVITPDGDIIFSGFTRARVPGPVPVLDSGITFIIGPSPDIAAFWAIVGSVGKGNNYGK